MKSLLIAAMLLASTIVHADSVNDALNNLLGLAFETGCLRYAFKAAGNTNKGYVKQFCVDETKTYIEELKKINPEPGSKVKTSDGTEISW
jgi:hypothetical protein